MANPILAGVMSFFVPGLGQFYTGQLLKAVLVFVFSWTVIVWLYGIYDAYRVASSS